MEIVSIPKKEYTRLKKLEGNSAEEDTASLKRSLADAKAGRIKR